MADHRDRDEDAPEAGNGPGASEPEFGSSEWLLQQLSGGRLSGENKVEASPAPDGVDEAQDASDEHEAPSGPRRSNWVEPPAATTPLTAPLTQPLPQHEAREPQIWKPDSEIAEPTTPSFDPQFARPEDTFDLFLQPPAEVEQPPADVAENAVAPVESPRDAEPASAPETSPGFEPGAPFAWNLTPGVGSDPLVEHTEPLADAPAAPVVPGFTESLRMPEPPSWDVLLTGAAAEQLRESSDTPTPSQEQEQEQEQKQEPEPPAEPVDVAPTAAPIVPEPPAARFTPEPPVVLVPPVFPPAMDLPPASEPEPEPDPERPNEPAEPVAGEAGAEESHGLASLLGFFDESADEQPSSRSVIGDTTGIVIVPDASAAVLPETPPVEPASPAPATPAYGTPAAAFFEPAAPAEPSASATPAAPSAPIAQDAPPLSPADTPTTQLNTAEIAALLNARTDDSQPEESLSPAPEAPAGIPPLEEAALLMGALPSPATQPLDAESLAEVSADTVAMDAAELEAALSGTGATETSNADDSDDSEDTEDTEEDGLAALFAQPAPATSPFTEPSAADAILFPELATAPVDVAPAPVSSTVSPASGAIAATGTTATASAYPVPAPGGPGGTGGGDGSGGGGGSAGRGGAGDINRLLFWVAGGLVVVLVLIGLFALGTRLPSLFGGVPVATSTSTAGASTTPTPTPTPTPTVQPKPAAAQPAGTHPWNTLGGGECIDPFTTPWAETFTVVDCAAPHAAQLVYTNLFSADPAAPYPGADALAQQINVLCTKPGIIDLAAAGAYPDLQLQGTYPATEQQWKDGQRSYYCFTNRSGGEKLTSSVAGPGPAA
ncbi:hypothetical protein [Leifsonia poae]|uniref:hypothetical protein n=1 Tax=Leifsonia poae TaxID=110933 RepID=UPI003D66B96C